jgi:thioredoxin reductase (NADPH)
MVSGIRVAQEAGGVEDMDVAGVFIYVGLEPQTSLLEGVVSVDRFGHVPVDQNMATAVPGLFAAGDVRQHSARQFATAAGDGVTAALAVCDYLRQRRDTGED